MAQSVVKLPADIHSELKVFAALKRQTMTEVAVAAIRAHLDSQSTQVQSIARAL